MAKDIEINVRVKTGQAQKGFDGLNKEISKTSVTAEGKFSPALRVSKHELGMMANQLLLTTGVAGKMTGQLSNLATGLLTGGFIGAAFAGFAAIINGVTQRVNEHNTAMKALTDSSMDAATKISLIKKELTALDDPSIWEPLIKNFNKVFGKETALERLGMQREMFMYQLGKAYGSVGFPESGYIANKQAQIELYRKEQRTAQTLKDAQSYNGKILQLQKEIDEALGKIQKEIDEALGKQEKKTEKIKTNYELMLERINKLRNAFTTQQNIYRAGQVNENIGLPGSVNYRASRETQGMVAVPEKPIINLGDFESMQNDMMQFAQSSAGIFSMNMNQAWESIFGEANSMFEQMLSAWQSMLFEKIGFGIFNMLFGGIDLFGFARNLTAGNATAAKYGMGR
jgi:gas vesicle protein